MVGQPGSGLLVTGENTRKQDDMTALAFTRAGAGAPLVLLHGLGSSRHAWNPVIPALAERLDVIAVDLPGFGDSEPLPPQVEPRPAALAAALAELLDDLGVTAPHIAGNSLGGWVALELARIRPAASLTLLSPAGLWRGGTPLYCRASLQASRWLCQHAAGPLGRLVNYRPGRALALGQTHGRPAGMTPEHARAVIAAMGTCPGFGATLKATATRRYLAGTPIDAPVTVAFGSRDFLLLRHQSRHLDELPPGTHVGMLPGCGHVPMADNPGAVTALITTSAARGPAGPGAGGRGRAAADAAG
jgi:pimeloyl-ACP methyl ester carboxylesterase